MNEQEKHRIEVINAPVRILDIIEQERLVKNIRIVLYNTLTTARMSFTSEFGLVIFNELCRLTDFNHKDREFKFLDLKRKASK